MGRIDRVREDEMLDVGDDSAELSAGGSSPGGDIGSGRERGEGGLGIVNGGGKYSKQKLSERFK